MKDKVWYMNEMMYLSVSMIEHISASSPNITQYVDNTCDIGVGDIDVNNNVTSDFFFLSFTYFLLSFLLFFHCSWLMSSTIMSLQWPRPTTCKETWR